MYILKYSNFNQDQGLTLSPIWVSNITSWGLHSHSCVHRLSLHMCGCLYL